VRVQDGLCNYNIIMSCRDEGGVSWQPRLATVSAHRWYCHVLCRGLTSTLRGTLGFTTKLLWAYFEC